jgi:hypothetical protein
MSDHLSTNRLGQIAILKAEQRALELGMVVSKPTIECRYDLVLDDGKSLFRVQAKYAGGKPWKGRAGVIAVGLRKWRGGGRKCIPCYTSSEIDAVLVYVVTLDRMLWFPPALFSGRRELQIRIAPAGNNQRKGCLFAADYYW